ncbi:MAG TPA: M20/M25/M40 family metallo-hydrolase [Vicinamibacterales bacterium]|nr:M20/M25/M40 family metallo-hydrolase [Vicinamibacterales bacterium]
MAIRRSFVAGAGLALGTVVALAATQGQGQGQPAAQAPAAPDPVQILVDRLSLDSYKATLKGLTQFGDRREGTQRNRDAVAWIEQQLKNYGCQTERMTYEITPRNAGGGGNRGGGAGAGTGAGGRAGAAGGAGGGGAAAAAGAGGQGRGGNRAAGPGVLAEPRRSQAGGSTYYGITRSTGVNNDPEKQPNEKLRALNSGPVLPDPIPQVWCTKWGTSRRGEMYIVSGHMDGIGWGEAANDDGSGTALVMELARIFSMPDVTTDVTIRFALWNGEETGHGARAYVDQRKDLQGQPNEPKWLGMVQHDMMMWDHGMPRADGTLNPEQRAEADFNIEWQSTSKQSDGAMKLALAVKLAADKYSKNYPGTLGPHMTATDSSAFQDIVPAISLRENERGMNTGAGWNPHWHQPTDVFTTFSDKDFLLGLNSAQATLSAIAQLTMAKVK